MMYLRGMAADITIIIRANESLSEGIVDEEASLLWEELELPFPNIITISP